MIKSLKFNVILAVNNNYQWIMVVQDSDQKIFDTKEDIILNDTFLLEDHDVDTYLYLKCMYGEKLINKLFTALYHKGFKAIYDRYNENSKEINYPYNLLEDIKPIQSLETENLSYYGHDVDSMFQETKLLIEHLPLILFQSIMMMGSDCFRENMKDALEYSTDQIFYLEN